MLKSFKCQFFPWLIYSQYPIIKKQDLDFRHFCKFIKKEKLNYYIDISIQTLYSVLGWSNLRQGVQSLLGYDATSFAHLDLGNFSAILLCRSFEPLSGWIETVSGQPISGLSRDFRLGSSQGCGWAAQGHSQSISQSHSCAVLAVCLGVLSCWKENRWPSRRSWLLWTRFSSRISLLCSVQLSLNPDSPPVPAAEKHPHSIMLPPPCFTVGMVVGR